MYCHLCGIIEQEYYIYYRIDDYEIVYCDKCADKKKREICCMCGSLVSFKYTEDAYRVCKKCNSNCDANTMMNYIINPSFKIGIYCGFCFQKKAECMNLTYMNVTDIHILWKYEMWRELYGNGECEFNLLNGHGIFKCCSKCRIKGCEENGWVDRLGYCREHMHHDKLRKELFKITNKYIYNDLAKFVISYVL